jgi:uncharacterized membrane protein
MFPKQNSRFRSGAGLSGLKRGYSSRDKLLHRLFTIGVWIKAIDGILETIGGTLYLSTSRAALSNLVFSLTQHELLEDPDDRLANWLRHVFGNLSANAKLLGGIYLLSHGVIKILLVTGLLRRKVWCYPVATAVLGVFIGYQVYRLGVHYSVGLLCLTVFDCLIVALIVREYRRVKRRQDEWHELQ